MASDKDKLKEAMGKERQIQIDQAIGYMQKMSIVSAQACESGRWMDAQEGDR